MPIPEVLVLQNHNRSAVDVGLQYVNNDACYPSLIVIGQIMEMCIRDSLITERHGGVQAHQILQLALALHPVPG